MPAGFFYTQHFRISDFEFPVFKNANFVPQNRKMKPILIAGISIVNLAMISYAIAITIQSRKKSITRQVLVFLTIGIILDITSTICMVISSGKVISFHGLIGYSSLAGMFTDTVLSFLNVKRNGVNTNLPRKFIRWSQAAFLYWVLAYFTGVIIVMSQ
jgi:hypothetical protein